ncbi:MAG TPA: LysR family transcriptional regulator [Rummeliibacillus sp.]|nr:LysR family transcriptional regulator [Rummeliibacillus sp.]
MDIKQLYYFCTIVEEGQITKAAARLHMAQPPLSQQLKQLENELDVVLFERQGRKLLLTDSGKSLYENAQKILADLEDIKTKVKEMNAGIRGKLSIGVSKTCFSYLPERIQYFRAEYPEVLFHIIEGDTAYISDLLVNRSIEVAITRFPIEQENIEIKAFKSEPYILIIPKTWKHLMSNKTKIALKEIKQLPLMLLHRIHGAGQFEIITNAFKDQQLKPNIILECPDVSILFLLVNSEIGATIVPKGAIKNQSYDNIHIIEIEDANIHSESGVIWLKDRHLSKCTQLFIDSFV